MFAYFSVTSLSSVVHISLPLILLFKKMKERNEISITDYIFFCIFFCNCCKVILNAGGIKCIFDFAVIHAIKSELCMDVFSSGVPTVNVVNKLGATELL